MAIFDDIEIEFRGVTYRIPKSRVMAAIEAIESCDLYDVDLIQGMNEGRIPKAKVSRAFSKVLQIAGAYVSQDEIYMDMWRDGGNVESISEACNYLLQMQIPPEVLRGINESDDDEGESTAKTSAKKKKGSSSKRTKRQSQDGE